MSRLDDLRADPTLAERLSPDEARDLLLEFAALAVSLRGLAAARAPAEVPAERLLTAEQVGERLGLTVKQVYRRADRWPFTRRVSPKTLRFDAAGLESYLGRLDRPRGR
jgi:hypothetical protein